MAIPYMYLSSRLLPRLSVVLILSRRNHDLLIRLIRSLEGSEQDEHGDAIVQQLDRMLRAVVRNIVLEEHMRGSRSFPMLLGMPWGPMIVRNVVFASCTEPSDVRATAKRFSLVRRSTYT